MCPAGKIMKYKGKTKRKDGIILNQYIGTGCGKCTMKTKCTKSNCRQIVVDPREKYRENMRSKLQTDKGREIYMKRQGIIEPIHGHDQKNMFWKQHYLRGKEKASLEFTLIRIGSNLGKIVKYGKEKLANKELVSA